MKPTAGPWTYNEEFREVAVGFGPMLARVVPFTPTVIPERESHANGYLMAAAPQLRDELVNLSRAVQNCLVVLEDNRSDEKDRWFAEAQMDAARERAERALASIFPPEQES